MCVWQQREASMSSPEIDASDTSSLLLGLQDVNEDDFTCGEMLVTWIICTVSTLLKVM